MSRVRTVTCETSDGLLIVHLETETCEVCAPSTLGPYRCKCKTLAHRLTGDGCDICNPTHDDGCEVVD